MTDTPQDLGGQIRPGQRVGPYTVVEEVGSGGMATVFRATDPRGRVVALKVLHPQSVQPEEVKRFTREYQTLQRLDHPNIVHVYETGMVGRFPWIAMEFVEGSDLDDVLSSWAEHPPTDRFVKTEALFRGMAEALGHIHDKGLIHRDVKPSNVLVAKDGTPKISDFGVVKDPDATGTQLTVAGRLVGTVAFMAPELISGEAVDPRADLYALGAVLYVMLTGKRPIEAKSVAGYLARHLTEVPAAPSSHDPSIPRHLEKVCQRLLAKEPSHRYQTAAAAIAGLELTEEAGPAPLRGRDDLMLAWSTRLQELRDGGGGELVLRGAPGSGRSHLLATVAELARTMDIAVAYTRGVDKLFSGLLESLGANGMGPDGLAEALEGQTALIAVDDFVEEGQGDALRALVHDRVTREGAAWLLAYPVDAAESDLHFASSGLPLEVMEIGPLERPAVIAMLRDRNLAGAAAPVLGRRLHADYGGNPGGVVGQFEALVESGWIEERGDELRATVPLDRFKKAALPVPRVVREALAERMDSLDVTALNLCRTLALLGRPSGPSLLCRCAGAGGLEAGEALDDLVRRQLLQREGEGPEELLRFAHPSAPAVVAEGMTEFERAQIHGRIAKVLMSRRRREALLEVAEHLMAAGDRATAYPMLIRAARREARAGLYSIVLRICERAEAIRLTAERTLEADEVVRNRRWLRMLMGEAHLGRGEWPAAAAHLAEAVEAAREEGDQAVVSRCLGSLGRAQFRKGDLEQAEKTLEEALDLAERGAPERAATSRALADIKLRSGEFAAARDLWQETLDAAVQSGSSDQEGRARRGLAHARALLGDLSGAALLLEEADDLLGHRGDPRVHAAVLARIVELDIAAGRLGNATHRSEQLLTLVRQQELAERFAEVLGLRAEALSRVGDTEGSLAAAREAETYATAFEARRWDARLRAARAYADGGALESLANVLPEPGEVPSSIIYDPPAQLAGLRARLQATRDPMGARDLAMWAMVRPDARLAISRAMIARDAGIALSGTGATEIAANAVRAGLDAMPKQGADGLILELLLVLYAATQEEAVADRASAIVERVGERLSPGNRMRFYARPDVARVRS
ncbi:MAG: tetratricopeptide repeat protein [Deltaproteobacteria bacterium]|nr:MAG: tetratricopeptide repeat protein [Deltaproteobacteria bacterium]